MYVTSMVNIRLAGACHKICNNVKDKRPNVKRIFTNLFRKDLSSDGNRCKIA